MIPVTSFAGKRVAVFGLGASGLAACKALLGGGAEVAAWDDTVKIVEDAKRDGVPTVDLWEADWAGISALVLSPGIPLTHPAPHWTVERARAVGAEVIGDVELFARERDLRGPKAPLIAVTGTNGKSTTTALIAHILQSAGRDVALGGNIGTAVLSLQPPEASLTYVLECSSFQIELAPGMAPNVGVLLNLSADHIDRHGTFENYASVKERLVARAATAVVGVDDPDSAAIAARLAAAGRRVTRIGTGQSGVDGVFAIGSDIVERRGNAERVIASLKGIGSLRGQHNAQNAAAAVAALVDFGLNPRELQEGLRTFRGLPHRMEEVGRRGRVLFVNDSKATNADATARALASFDRIYWILGGRAKEGGIGSLAEYFPRIAKAYLIGEATPRFGDTLAGKVAAEISGTLATALSHAAVDAASDEHEEPVVLLSPAAASYDQFRNFEHRGDTFRTLVRAMEGVTRTEAA